MKFTWKAFLLAPLLAPFLFTLALVIYAAGKIPVQAVFVSFAIGSIFSYGMTVVLFLPGLYLLSRLVALTTQRVCLLGTTLGVLAFLPVAWQDYLTTGENSGSPLETFGDFFLRQLSEPLWWWLWGLFPLGGLLTATAYWLLVTKPAQQEKQ